MGDWTHPDEYKLDAVSEPPPRVHIGIDSPLARQMGLCKGGEGFWCGALINNGAEHRPGCPEAASDESSPDGKGRNAPT